MSMRYKVCAYSENVLQKENNEGRSAKFDYDGLNTSEGDFRGFERVPLVICERLDVTPYLNKNKSYTETSQSIESLNPNAMVEAQIINGANFDKILHKCSVILVRDDLEQLKELVKNKSHILNGASSLKCKICNKQYSSGKKLQNHIENKHIIYKSPDKTPKRVSFSDHIIVHEVKEYHRCRKCPKIFEDFVTLKLHMRQKHKKRKCYICFYCSKDFVDRTFFKVHIKLHCDACGLLLPTRKKYLEHRRNVCRIIKKYQCKTCQLLFFNFMDLKDHTDDHMGKIFICDICKEQFITKCAVAHHIKYLHSNKKPKSLYEKRTVGNESVNICHFCEESATDEGTIDGQDYYFCEQCLKQFNIERDPLQRNRTHFLKRNDSDNTQEESKESSFKLVYKVGEELPSFLQPKLIMERLQLPKIQVKPPEIPKIQKKPPEIPKIQEKLPEVFAPPTPPPTLPVTQALAPPVYQQTILNGNESLKRPIIDPISKKTIISKYQCMQCGKYLSSNYSLNRHMRSVHGINKDGTNANNLQCAQCEEVFVWKSLLATHNCIRSSIPEMPFEDARPEIHFDNYNSYMFGDLELEDDGDEDDFMNSADYEIPAPIVELKEYDNVRLVIADGPFGMIDDQKGNEIDYKIMLQEVPVEF